MRLHWELWSWPGREAALWAGSQELKQEDTLQWAWRLSLRGTLGFVAVQKVTEESSPEEDTCPWREWFSGQGEPRVQTLSIVFPTPNLAYSHDCTFLVLRLYRADSLETPCTVAVVRDTASPAVKPCLMYIVMLFVLYDSQLHVLEAQSEGMSSVGSFLPVNSTFVSPLASLSDLYLLYFCWLFSLFPE